MNKRNKIQYFAVALGWIYNGLLMALSVQAVFSPGHKLLLNFNRFGELWFDVGLFTFAFVLMTWYLFIKLPKQRKKHSKNE